MAKVTDPNLLNALNGTPAGGASVPSLAPIAPIAKPAPTTPQAPYAGDALTLLRGFEGFRDTPYWDVNANRIGYGSDTITRADGSVVKVAPGMSVTRDEAEADLARRARDFEQTASGQIGADAWAALPSNAKAALTSVTYNYGSLPDSVVNAARGGDVNAIADAVYGLSSHNGGVNAKRRAAEASIIRGEEYTPATSSSAPSGQQQSNAASPAVAGQQVTDPAVLRLLNEDAAAVPEVAQNALTPLQDFSDLPIPSPTGEDLSTPRPAGEVVLGGLRQDAYDLNTMGQNAWNALVNAVSGPGAALRGEMAPEVDPRTGAVNPYPDSMISSATDAAALMLGNGPGMAGRGMMAGEADTAAAALARQGAADEFGVPLTQGQANRSLADLVAEENMRQSTNNAGKIVQNFDTRQQGAVADAVTGLVQKAGTGGENMGQTVLGAIDKIVTDQRANAEALYGKAFGGNLTLPSSALNDLPDTVAARLVANDTYVDPAQTGGITPTAQAALRIIDEAAGNLPTNPDGTVNLVQSLRTVERIRRRLVGLEGSTGEDRRAVREIKAGFDEWLDNAVDKALIHGDDEAIEALKGARAEWSAYKKLTNAEPGDQAQNAFVKMQREDATAEEVANWLYGADIASPSLAAPKVASLVRQTVGEDSPAWSAVRASAVERLLTNPNTGDPRTPLMISNRIDQFLNNKGQSLSSVLFSDAERQELARFSAVLKDTLTPRNAQNPSRTAHTLMNSIKKLSGELAGVVGTVVAGPGAGVAAALAYPVFKNAKEARAATKATTRVTPKRAPQNPPASTSNALTRLGIAAPEEKAQEEAPTRNVLLDLIA